MTKLTIAVCAWFISILIALFSGLHYGALGEKLKNDELKAIAEEAGKAAQKGAAIEISKIRVRNTTIQGRMQTIIKDNPVYRDCNHDDATFRMLNESITGQEPSNSSVSKVDTTK